MSRKLVKKLQEKKTREETGLFLVEGKKNLHELLLSDFTVQIIYATLEELSAIESACDTYGARMGVRPEIIVTTEEKLADMGTFRTNNTGIAIARQKSGASEDTLLKSAHGSLVLVLDEVKDPGNLGTIMRTADWFGVTHIVTSEHSTDPYNPKAIAASMGSFARVSVTALPLVDFVTTARDQGIACMGAFLDGRNIFAADNPKSGLLIMGSESHGISNDIASLITDRITIPRYGKAESLNVATATGIFLALLTR